MNILFNLGYIFTDAMNLYTLFTDTSAISNKSFFYKFGFNIGDFILRLFYMAPFSTPDTSFYIDL